MIALTDYINNVIIPFLIWAAVIVWTLNLALRLMLGGPTLSRPEHRNSEPARQTPRPPVDGPVTAKVKRVGPVYGRTK